jgi:hypothetical protein
VCRGVSLNADLRAGSCARRSDARFGLGHDFDWAPLPDGRHPFTVDDRSSIHFAGWGIAPDAIVDCEAQGMAAVSDIGLRANFKLAARHGRASRSGDIFVVYQLTTRLKYSDTEQLHAEVHHPPQGGAATADDGDGDDDGDDDADADADGERLPASDSCRCPRGTRRPPPLRKCSRCSRSSPRGATSTWRNCETPCDRARPLTTPRR